MPADVLADFEELIEAAWVAVLGNQLPISSRVTGVYRWESFRNLDFGTEASPKGNVLVHCTGIVDDETLGNTILANPGFVELAAVTRVRYDQDGTVANTILGAIRDAIALSDIVTQLNATDRLNVFSPSGVRPEGQTFREDTETHRVRSKTVACYFTATTLE